MYEKETKSVESRAGFIAWAAEPDGNTRFAIFQEAPGYGYHWVRYHFDGYRAIEAFRSQGCFYDGVPEHPEGALQWAKDGAAASWEKTKKLLAEP